MTNVPDRSIWRNEEGEIQIVDQRYLPHTIRIASLLHSDEAIQSIAEMWVRGAPLIGATAAYGMSLVLEEATEMEWLQYLQDRAKDFKAARPTAVNLAWAVDRMLSRVSEAENLHSAREIFRREADLIAEEDIAVCFGIGTAGLTLLENIYAQTGKTVQILTHCNAGRMATVQWGTATAPIYRAHQAGLPIHVWVDETRPRNQGARITAWELGQAGIPHTVIADNTGGHLMQSGQVDICLVGTDRTARNGDVANKIGTYLKALAAHDNRVPFYVALPLSTLDWSCASGKDIPIEERSAREVTHIWGESSLDGLRHEVRLTPEESPGKNFGFDITPARLVSGLITEKGVCEASEQGLKQILSQE